MKDYIRRVLENGYSDSELVIGLVYPLGTAHNPVLECIEEQLVSLQYNVQRVRISSDVIPGLVPEAKSIPSESFARLNALIDYGDLARERFKMNEVLALGAINVINSERVAAQAADAPRQRHAYIITSLKHPDEVRVLRQVYGAGFYLFGLFSHEQDRLESLRAQRMTPDQAKKLIERDSGEEHDHGQQTTNTFHLADFFVHVGSDATKTKHDIIRLVDLMFGNQEVTPTPDEFAMYMAFASSLRSADLSRQVGAVIARDNDILATGTNDCPRFRGGLYWPVYDQATHKYVDEPRGRDRARNEDSNAIEKKRIVDEVIGITIQPDDPRDRSTVRKRLAGSTIGDLTEYGRVVHAEMEALLGCARHGVSTRGATLYCTTFPCHNCAKHVIAAGIVRVVFVEPYLKSRAFQFHDEAIVMGPTESQPGVGQSRVEFVPFVGVGPRRFFDLFSMKLGSGYPVKRKDGAGKVLPWDHKAARLRTQLIPSTYMETHRGKGGEPAMTEQEQERKIANFRENMKRAAIEVSKWPEWKQNILGVIKEVHVVDGDDAADD